MRDVGAPGTPDGILMSGISSVLSDFRSDALMPSKCTQRTFREALRTLSRSLKLRKVRSLRTAVEHTRLLRPFLSFRVGVFLVAD